MKQSKLISNKFSTNGIVYILQGTFRHKNVNINVYLWQMYNNSILITVILVAFKSYHTISVSCWKV